CSGEHVVKSRIIGIDEARDVIKGRPCSVRVADRLVKRKPLIVESEAHDVELAQATSGGDTHEWPRVIADGNLDVTQGRPRPVRGYAHDVEFAQATGGGETGVGVDLTADGVPEVTEGRPRSIRMADRVPHVPFVAGAHDLEFARHGSS